MPILVAGKTIDEVSEKKMEISRLTEDVNELERKAMKQLRANEQLKEEHVSYKFTLILPPSNYSSLLEKFGNYVRARCYKKVMYPKVLDYWDGPLHNIELFL